MSDTTIEYSLSDNLIKKLKDGLFLDQNNVLEQIDNKIDTNSYINLYGLSGSGKSTNACEYAHKYYSKYNLVHLFEADSQDKLNLELRVFLNIKNNVDIVEMEQNYITEHINTKFNNNESVLFIFDNLPEKYQFIFKYLKMLPNNIKIILTSRKPIRVNLFTNIEIKPFNKEQAEVYLNNNNYYFKNKLNQNEIKKLIEILKEKSTDTVFPFRLRNASFLLSTNQTSFKELVKELEITNQKTDQAELAILIQKSINDKKIFQIIKYIAYLESGFVSFEIILNLNESKKEEIKNSLNTLIKLGLIEKTEKYGKMGIKICENVQSEMIKYINTSREIKLDMKLLYFDLLTCFREMFKIENPWSDWLEMSFSYFHVVKLINMTRVFYENIIDVNDFDLNSKDLLSELIKNVGIFNIYALTNYKNGIFYFNEFYKFRNEIHMNKIHKTKADALQYIGLCYFKMDEFNNIVAAIAYYNDACSMKQELYETEMHPEIAVLKHNIGNCYDKIGNTDEAIKYKRESLKIRQSLGDLKEIAKSLNSLAITYEKSGDLSKALLYDKKNLDIKRKIYKNSHLDDNQDELVHPEVVDTLYNLANSSFKMGEWKTAAIYYEELYYIYKTYDSNKLHVDEKRLKNVLDHLEICYLKLGLQDKADYYGNKYEILKKPKKNANLSGEKLIKNNDLTKIDIDSSSLQKTDIPPVQMPAQQKSNINDNERTKNIKNPREWDKKKVLDYLKNENINPKLIDSLCSPEKLAGNVLDDYYLILSHNSSFLNELLKNQSAGIGSNDIEMFVFSLRKLFS